MDDKSITDKSLFEDLYFGRLKEVYDTKYVNAAAWLLPRKTLETVGGFDPIFSHYGEDDNYIHRVIFHGMKIGVCPFSVVVHDTERRITSTDKKVQNSDAVLLAEATNINEPVNINSLCFYHFRKAFSKAISGKLPQSKKHWADFGFLRSRKKTIKISRAKNTRLGPTWL